MGMAKRKKRRKGECKCEKVIRLMFWPSSGSWVSNSGKGVWGRRYWRKDFHGWPISLAQTEPTPRVLGQTAPPRRFFFGKLADISREFAIILLNGLRKCFPSSVLFLSVSARLPSPWKIAKKKLVLWYTMRFEIQTKTVSVFTVQVSPTYQGRMRLHFLFVTPWTVAPQASLSITNSHSLLKLMSIELVMPSNHFILQHHSSKASIHS